jgi:hypothetical protein
MEAWISYAAGDFLQNWSGVMRAAAARCKIRRNRDQCCGMLVMVRRLDAGSGELAGWAARAVWFQALDTLVMDNPLCPQIASSLKSPWAFLQGSSNSSPLRVCRIPGIFRELRLALPCRMKKFGRWKEIACPTIDGPWNSLSSVLLRRKLTKVKSRGNHVVNLTFIN